MLNQRADQLPIKYPLLSLPKHLQLAVAGCVGLLLGIASLWFSPRSVLIALAAGGLVFAILKRPEIGLLGLLVITSSIFPEASFPRIPIGIGTVYLPDLILLGSLGLIVIRHLAEADFKIVRTPLDLPLLAFYGIAMLSTASAVRQSSLTLNESLGEVRRVNSYLTFFIVTNLVREDRQIRLLWKGIFLLAAVVGAGMAAQYFLGASVHILPGRVEALSTEGVTFSDVTRIIPPGESLVLAAFITLTALLTLGKFKPAHIWRLLVCGLTGLAILLTFKRHYFVIVGLALLILAYLGGGQRFKLLGCGLAAALTIATILVLVNGALGSELSELVSGATERLGSLADPRTFEDPRSSLRWRDFEYSYALPQIASHPLSGLGLGSTYRPWVSGKDWEGYDGRSFIHNGHLHIMLKSGLLGYAFLAWLSLAFLWRAYKYWQLVPDREMRALMVGCLLTYAGVLIGSVVSPILINANWTPVIGIMMGTNEVILGRTVHGWQGRDR